MSDIRVAHTIALSTVLVAATFVLALFGGRMVGVPNSLAGISTTVLAGVVIALLLVGAGLSNIGFQIRNVGAQGFGLLLTFIGFFMVINMVFALELVAVETVQTVASMAVLYFVALVAYAYRQHKTRFSNWEIPAVVAVVLTLTLGFLSQNIKVLEPFAFIVGTLAIMAHIFFVTGLTKRVQQGTVANTARLYTAFIALPVDVLVYIVLLIRRVRE